jgi:hypothetical protein
LKDTRVEHGCRFVTNDWIIVFDSGETRNRLRFKHRALSSDHKKREKEVQRRKEKGVIGKIFLKSKVIPAPQIQVREATGINSNDSCEWIIDGVPPITGKSLRSCRTSRRLHIGSASRSRLHHPARAVSALTPRRSVPDCGMGRRRRQMPGCSRGMSAGA